MRLSSVLANLLSLATTQSAGAASENGKKPGEATAANEKREPINPYQAGADRIRTTTTWLVGALAAVATVMLAGSQLSTIGALSFPDDTARLATAAVAALIAVAAVAYAIYRLTLVQAPVEMGLEHVRAQAAQPESKLARMADADKGLRANYATLAEFLEQYDSLRDAEYAAEGTLRGAKAEAAKPTEDPKVAAQRQADVASATKVLEAAHERVSSVRPQMVHIVQLAGFLAVRSLFDDERRRVLSAALLAAVAIVCFAWAANPPKEADSSGAALAQNPKLATLTLTEDGRERLEPLLGKECAAAAVDEGLQVIALSATDASHQVVLVPAGDCVDPVTFTVEKEDGALVAADDVL